MDEMLIWQQAQDVIRDAIKGVVLSKYLYLTLGPETYLFTYMSGSALSRVGARKGIRRMEINKSAIYTM